MKKPYVYLGDCTHLDGELLSEMCDKSVPVTLRTIQRHCEGVAEWAKAHNYDRHLPMSRDWHISYFKSFYNGRPCYFIDWSAIESVWILPESEEYDERFR